MSDGSHDYHPGLPGYHPDQLLHDGCGVCERRAKVFSNAIAHMDAERFAQAWKRTCDWQRGGNTETRVSPTLSKVECEVYENLWSVIVQLERRGIPIGEAPSAAHHPRAAEE